MSCLTLNTCPLHPCCPLGPGGHSLSPAGPQQLTEMETQRPGWGGDWPGTQEGRVEWPSAARMPSFTGAHQNPPCASLECRVYSEGWNS